MSKISSSIALCTFVAATALGMARCYGSTFSAYADVWDWQPSIADPESVRLHFRALPDGDVLVSADINDGSESSSPQQHLAFFSRRSFQSVEEVFNGQNPDWVDTPYVERPGGNLLRGIALDDCTRGVGSGLYLQDASGQTLRGTALILLLREPKRRPAIHCEDQAKSGFQSDTVILSPTRLLSLRDGTVLIGDREVGLVLRVIVQEDGTVCSESPLVGNRLFLADTAWVEREFQGFLKHRSMEGRFDWPAFFSALRGNVQHLGERGGRCSDLATRTESK
ncbi:MAG: hypothetical protein L0312_17040 [Acidobacteria bacterium]|nr:hypothetical protein [Acidobacteriota bacterium]